MASIIVEQSFEQPCSDEQYADFARRLDSCLEARRGTWVRSSLSADRKRMICEFEAPDAEAVREALHTAGVPFDRVWLAQVWAVEDYPELLAKLLDLRRSAPAPAQSIGG